MKTKQQCINTFVRRYPGCSVPAVQEELFDDTFKDIMTMAEFRVTSLTFAGIIAGIFEYQVSAVMMKAYSATWWNDVNTPIPLKLTSVDGLRDLNPGWDQRLSTQEGIPRQFYLVGRPIGSTAAFFLGFDQTPQASTVGGYPYVVLDIQAHTELALTDTVPETLPDEEAIVSGMCWRWALEQDRGEVDGWKKIMDTAIMKAVEYVQMIAPELPNQTLPAKGALTARLV